MLCCVRRAWGAVSGGVRVGATAGGDAGVRRDDGRRRLGRLAPQRRRAHVAHRRDVAACRGEPLRRWRRRRRGRRRGRRRVLWGALPQLRDGRELCARPRRQRACRREASLVSWSFCRASSSSDARSQVSQSLALEPSSRRSLSNSSSLFGPFLLPFCPKCWLPLSRSGRLAVLRQFVIQKRHTIFQSSLCAAPPRRHSSLPPICHATTPPFISPTSAPRRHAPPYPSVPPGAADLSRPCATPPRTAIPLSHQRATPPHTAVPLSCQALLLGISGSDVYAYVHGQPIGFPGAAAAGRLCDGSWRHVALVWGAADGEARVPYSLSQSTLLLLPTEIDTLSKSNSTSR